MRQCIVVLSAIAAVASAGGDPVGSVTGLITRLLGASRVPQFALDVIPADPSTGLDVWEVDTNGTQVVLRGNTGVALASGLGAYLRGLNASWHWGRNGTGNQLSHLPPTLPLPAARTRAVTPNKWRYYANVCVAGVVLRRGVNAKEHRVAMTPLPTTTVILT